MRKTAKVVIIGAGCTGASAAYQLAVKHGEKDVVVLDKDFLAAGATGRCGGGMRQQWSTRGNIRLAQRSIAAFKNFKDETGQDCEFWEGGYLLPAWTEEMVADFHKNIKLQNEENVNSWFVSPKEIKDIAPIVDSSKMLGGAYCPNDGKANPFLVVKGWCERAADAGVEINVRTEVTGFKTSGDKVTHVETGRGTIECEYVINAAGGHSGVIGNMLGLSLPVSPERHQILVTEPVKPCHNPMVIDLHHNIYFSQAKHGAFIAGHTDVGEPSSFNIRNNWQFPIQISRKLCYLAPPLGRLKVVRAWAGLYTMTPDAQPIIGPTPEFPNFLNAIGFSGHGFMLSPVTGTILAELITRGEVSVCPIEDFDIKRFADGTSGAKEANVV